MGTIAQKLEYLNDTRLLLKDNINKINNVLTDNSTFRSYPQELFNGYLDILNNGTDTLWNNLEKVSASGEEATLENVETAPMKMILNGNTSQETTTGKNKLNTTEISQTTANGITCTYNSATQEINFNGTCDTNNTTFTISNSSIDFTSNSTTVSAHYVSGSASGTCAVRNFNSDYSISINFNIASLSNSTPIISKTATATFTSPRTTIRFDNGSVANNFKIKLMTADSTNTDWEKFTYGASPNPDYPQQVKVVTGENVVSVSGKNLFSNQNLVHATIKDDGTYLNGDARLTSDFAKIPNSVAPVILSANTSMFFCGIAFYDENKDFISRIFANNTKTINGNVPENAKYCRGFIQIRYNLVIDETSLITYEIQLEQNSQATPYVPFSKTDYTINLGTIELCKIGDYKDYFHKDNGKWYVHKEIGKVVLDGSESWVLSSLGAGKFYLEISPIFKMIGETAIGIKPYSSHFVGKDNSLGFENGKVVLMTSSYGGTTHYFTRFENDNTPTLSEWKTWLSNNNVKLYYVLSVPTEEEITNTTLIEQLEAISKAKSVKDKTYITQTNDDLPFILDVEAIKEYEVN